MSLRFGDKTRAGEPVTAFGQRASSGTPRLNLQEQIFTSPGTWTCPPIVSSVDLFIVGGGGGGGGSDTNLAPLAGFYGGGGGGGRVIQTFGTPVTGPVPVTVGAGGTGGQKTFTNATNGGTSAFGPLGPGPIPAIPTSTIAAGGGGGGGSAFSPFTFPTYDTYRNGQDAPPIGGGGGGGCIANPNPAGSFGGRGYFGSPGGDGFFPGFRGRGGGAMAMVGELANNPAAVIGLGIDGYGGGGTNGFAQWYGDGALDKQQGFPVIANTGAGGSGGFASASPPTAEQGEPGAAGIVIVRWLG